jgi:glycosyltransferase involved in cell wall biosynthesis
MITLSLAMIVKNEESVLARCLDSIKEMVDEIIIVDTGSTDKTVEIACGYTSFENVHYFYWINDFAAARNFAL